LEDFDTKMGSLVAEIEAVEGSTPPEFESDDPLKNTRQSTLDRAKVIYESDLSFFEAEEACEDKKEEDDTQQTVKESMSVREAKRYD
jgi:hypothetical protein